MLFVTALAAAALALLNLRLTVDVIRLRKSRRVGIGDGEDAEIARAVRAHANLVEHAPLALILMACLELNGGTNWLLVPLAAAFVAGRAMHARGIARSSGVSRDRTVGMHLTLWPTLALAVVNVVQALRAAIG